MMDYRRAGVNLEEAAAAKRAIASHARTTFTESVLRDVGHFGGFFRLPESGPSKPVLVASTDGVGTKLLLAGRLNRLEGIGEDLVHHCINDILTCGALPLSFLDYIAFGKLERGRAETIAASLARGCRAHGVALVGGETAEMPDLYQKSDFDLAGTIVGWVGEDDILDGSRVVAGDVLLGLASNGLHTNGYSLARKVFAVEIDKGELTRPDAALGESVADALLKPHTCYLNVIRPLLSEGFLHAMAHITGGGVVDNLQRVLPSGLRAEIDWRSWPRLPIFELIASKGKVDEEEMRRVFNLGVGFVLVVSGQDERAAAALLRDKGEEVHRIGRVVA
jgi:phosphoribosylformylglycinamidine cyclo-ligase